MPTPPFLFHRLSTATHIMTDNDQCSSQCERRTHRQSARQPRMLWHQPQAGRFTHSQQAQQRQRLDHLPLADFPPPTLKASMGPPSRMLAHLASAKDPRQLKWLTWAGPDSLMTAGWAPALMRACARTTGAVAQCRSMCSSKSSLGRIFSAGEAIAMRKDDSDGKGAIARAAIASTKPAGLGDLQCTQQCLTARESA